MTNNSNSSINAILASMSPSAQEVVSTMQAIKNHYIETDWDVELRRRFDKLLRTIVMRRSAADEAWTERRETRAVVYTGEEGIGKTESLDRLFRTHPATAGYNVFGSGCPLMSVSVPATASSIGLGHTILQKAGRPVYKALAEHAVWAQVHHQLELAGIAILHLDEMHNLTDSANISQIDHIRKRLKALMVSPTWPVALVISGLPSIVPEMRAVGEIRRRGQFIQMPLMVTGALDRICKLAGLSWPDDRNLLAGRLVHAAIHRFGVMIELIQEAVELTLLDGVEELTVEHFAAAYADRTGCGRRMNPFLAADWPQLDCSLVLMAEPPSQILPAGSPRLGRGQKGSK
jgi:hypothetical protein